MKEVVSFRLRKVLDADLREAIDKMGATELEVLDDLCRDGLRFMLGIRTTKRIEVTETTLSLPVRHHDIPAQRVERQAEPQRTPLREQMKKAPANNAGATWRPSGR